MKKITVVIFLIVMAFWAEAWAQHRGDLLSFQGIDETTDGGAESMAMGGAFTAMSGSIDNLFHNVAGLAALKKYTISIGGNYYRKDWWENQVYRPDRYFVTLPFYLEGMYVPDPKNNGVLDRDLALDSSYVVQPPRDAGKEVDSRAAADWTRRKSAPVFNNIALALPFELLKHKIVVAAAYQQKINFLDFDRNDTYLVPLIGYSGYQGFVPRINGNDTLNLQWYKYSRERTGTLKSFRLAIAGNITQRFNAGVSLEFVSGKSTDWLRLNKNGYFGLIDENKFFFSYDTLNHEEKGTSDFSSFNAHIGLQYRFDHVTAGLNVTLPRTWNRQWSYSIREQTALNTSKREKSGKDRFEVPAVYQLGLAFIPVKSFTFSMAYRWAPYHHATFKLARTDSTFRPWPNQHAVMAGIRYCVNSYWILMAGYRWESAVFVPDGAAYRAYGPYKTSVTLGTKLAFGSWGSLVLAAEFRSLKYHDTYFSNTNYASERFQNFMIGYVYQF